MGALLDNAAVQLVLGLADEGASEHSRRFVVFVWMTYNYRDGQYVSRAGMNIYLTHPIQGHVTVSRHILTVINRILHDGKSVTSIRLDQWSRRVCCLL